MSAITSSSQSEQGPWSVIDAEIVLPIQFAVHEENRAEKRLMIAVLEEAVATFQRTVGAKSRGGQRLFREADDWIQSTDTSWAFAFESVCDTLGLDPAYLRAGLEHVRQGRPAGGARIYRFRRVTGRRNSVVPLRSGRVVDVVQRASRRDHTRRPAGRSPAPRASERKELQWST